MNEITNHPIMRLGNLKISKSLYDNSSKSQQARLLKFLELNGKISTMKARETLGILHPCGRSKELRARGYRIETHWIKEIDANGVLHRVGLYVYKGHAGDYHEG